MDNKKIKTEIADHLPPIRGRYVFDTPMFQYTWFKVGGPASILVKPKDVSDLSFFLKHRNHDIPLITLGAASNILIRDGGFQGFVLKMGSGFASVKIEENFVIAGASCLDRTLALKCRDYGLGGLEFLIGIPGTVGGAIAMNAGAYGSEIKDYLVWVDLMSPQGSISRISAKNLNMTYRNGNIDKGHIVIQAAFKCFKDSIKNIQTKIDHYLTQRESSQPIQGRTGGSTFKNPLPHVSAWELIDSSGCRGLTIGNAQISEKHCNFILNLGKATATDIETLAETVRSRVYAETSVKLEWEIIRYGNSKTYIKGIV